MRYEERLISEITDLKLIVNTLTAAMYGAPEWFTLRKACQFKGVEYNSVKVSKDRQPLFGIPEKMDGTRKYWSRRTIVEWCAVISESDRLNYRKAHLKEYENIYA